MTYHIYNHPNWLCHWFQCMGCIARYNCNRFDEEEAKAARDAQERSRAALQRYLFYCNRYMNHMQSLKFENKLYASVKEKMEEMQQHNMSWIEVCEVNASHQGIFTDKLMYLHVTTFTFVVWTYLYSDYSVAFEQCVDTIM